MKWVKSLLLALIVSLPATAANNSEFRATWVITWEIYSGGLPQTQVKARIRKILDDHVAANMNAVLWQVRQSGTAYYESSYEPWGYYLGGKNPGFDPFAYAVEQAHIRGLEIHAWVNCFHTSSTAPGSPAYEHPEWVCTNRDGEYMSSRRCLSPGVSAVREYTVNVFKEIVENYNVDGLHLDFCRWNEYDEDDMSSILSTEEEIRVIDGMEIAKKQLLKPGGSAGSKPYLYDSEHPYNGGVPEGFSTWAEWRRWSVTEFVKLLSESVNPIKPWVRISVAALGNYNWGGWNGYHTVFQDAALWFNEGYIDQLTPMHYHWYNESPAYYHVNSFVDMLWGPGKDNVWSSCWGRYIQPGIQAGRLYSCGPNSITLGSTGSWLDPSELVTKVRDVPWVDGFQFFSYGIWESSNSWADAASSYFSNRTKIRAFPARDDHAPEPPQIAVAAIDTFTYEITVTPTTDEPEGGWIAIYRSPTQPIDLDVAPFVAIRFGTEPFTLIDTVRIGFNNSFFYTATAFDRSWNESALSNIFETPRIPVYSYTPDPIALNYIRHTTNGVEIAWTPPSKLDNIMGYRLYGKTPDGEWELLRNERVLRSSATSTTVTGLDGDNWLFTVRPVGQGPLKIEATEQTLYGIGGSGSERILIVDSFTRRDGAWTQSAHPFTARVCEQLQTLDASFDCATRDAVRNDLVDLAPYRAVFWLCGDNDHLTDTIDLSSMTNVTRYLGNGGQLLISGSNIGLDLYEHGARNSKAFFNSYLKANYIGNGENGNGYSAIGNENGIFPGLTLHFDDGTYGFDVASPDLYEAHDGGIACLSYSDGSGTAGIQYEGTIGSSTAMARLLHFGFPVETLHDGQELQSLLKVALTFFGLEHGTDVISNTPVMSDFYLTQNYPNPFNPTTSIRYTLDRTAPVSLRVFDLSGRQVRTLVQELQSAGSYSVSFNAEGLPSGVYFYRLEFAGEYRTKKMLLLQ
ncbi:family 10 glycosylhydrolase [candidate division KSB1 bacterium]|nr:family 10 glycosylhydrolase [candidate division KSB1 bacterium]